MTIRDAAIYCLADYVRRREIHRHMAMERPSVLYIVPTGFLRFYG